MENSKLKFYTAYSRNLGEIHGAALVVAHSAKEAKRLAWKYTAFFYDEYIDVGIKWIRGDNAPPLADQTKLAAGQPHVVDDPIGCETCHIWGAGLTSDNRCGWCGEDPGDRLIKRLSN